MNLLILLFLAAPRIVADPASVRPMDMACALSWLESSERRLMVRDAAKAPLFYTVTTVNALARLHGDGISGTWQNSRIQSIYDCHAHEIAHHAIWERNFRNGLPGFVNEGLAKHLSNETARPLEHSPAWYYRHFDSLRGEAQVRAYEAAQAFVELTFYRSSWGQLTRWLDSGAQLETYRQHFGIDPDQLGVEYNSQLEMPAPIARDPYAAFRESSCRLEEAKAMAYGTSFDMSDCLRVRTWQESYDEMLDAERKSDPDGSLRASLRAAALKQAEEDRAKKLAELRKRGIYLFYLYPR